ncbi:MAG: class I SAM-dependent methyltransferase [candidate division Zixibacteria bacterium]|nr:class I SAM-dependent methyltransferase [candidate division Zixibacteria bacterium]
MTRWQQFYLEDERVLSTPPSDCSRTAVEAFSKRNKHFILDLGCGVGRDSFYLAENGFFVVGVDLAESALTIADHFRKKKKKNIVLLRADARDLPFPDASFEGIYCFGLLHEFTGETKEDDIREVMAEIYRVLEPAGLLVLAVLSGEPDEGLPHVYLFTEQMFDAATRSFQHLDKREYYDIGCTGKKDYRVWCGVFTK